MKTLNMIFKFTMKRSLYLIAGIGLLIISGCDILEDPRECNKKCDDGYMAFEDMDCMCPEDGMTDLEKLYYYARHLHDIDLLNDLRYMGWFEQDFWNGETAIYSAKERLIIASAQILKKWEDENLVNNRSERIEEVDDYCAGEFETKDGYAAWCSEFVSYVYRKAGMPLHQGYNEFWCHPTFTWLREWFEDKEEFVDYHEGADRNSYTPRVGDYLNKDETHGDNEGHSMLILGPIKNTKGFWTGEVVIIEGNVDGLSPDEKRVRIYTKDIFNSTELRGVGKLDLGDPYAIIFDLNWWHKFSTEPPYDEYSHWRIRSSYSNLSDLGTPNANNKASSIYLANGVELRVYENINYNGDNKTYTSSVGKLENDGFRNNISSIKFE